jgi:hypothetical protein
MFGKKPSLDESPLQDLSEDQMNQVAGGRDSSCSRDWDWKHHHHYHHWNHRNTRPVTVEVIIIEPNGSKKTYWQNGSSWNNNTQWGSGHW